MGIVVPRKWHVPRISLFVKSKKSKISKKSNIIWCQNYDILGTCHLLGTTVLIFEKLEPRAFRKVYGLWGYFQPEKSAGDFETGNNLPQNHALNQGLYGYGYTILRYELPILKSPALFPGWEYPHRPYTFRKALGSSFSKIGTVVPRRWHVPRIS